MDSSFREADGIGAAGASEYNDLLAAAAFLGDRPDVDAKRIGLWGGSYGGYLTALGLARNSDLFAAGVDLHGVHDWYHWTLADRDNVPLYVLDTPPTGAHYGARCLAHQLRVRLALTGSDDSRRR